MRLGLEYAPLWEQGPELRVTTSDAGLSLAYLNPPHPDPLASTIDSQELVVFLAALCHHLAGPGAARTHGHFACPRPPRGRHLDRVRAVGCRPHFAAAAWRIDLPRALLDHPLPPANPAVARLVRTHVDEQLRSTVAAADLPARLDLALRRGLAQRWGVAQVARALAMSPRTLQQARPPAAPRSRPSSGASASSSRTRCSPAPSTASPRSPAPSASPRCPASHASSAPPPAARRRPTAAALTARPRRGSATPPQDRSSRPRVMPRVLEDHAGALRVLGRRARRGPAAPSPPA